jgi:hypothetical protein
VTRTLRGRAASAPRPVRPPGRPRRRPLRPPTTLNTRVRRQRLTHQISQAQLVSRANALSASYSASVNPTGGNWRLRTSTYTGRNDSRGQADTGRAWRP